MRLLNVLSGDDYLFINGQLLIKTDDGWQLSTLDEGNHITTLSAIQDWINDGLMKLL